MSRSQNPKRWMRLKRVIEEVRKNPGRPTEIKSKLEMPERTVDHNLKLGVHIGIFRQLKDKRYAWIDFSEFEEDIRALIKSGGARSIDDVALRLGKTPDDIKIPYYKVIYEEKIELIPPVLAALGYNHSEKLKEALERWLDVLQKNIPTPKGWRPLYESPIASIYHKGETVSFPKVLEEPQHRFLVHLKEHLATGYPDITKSWESLIINANKYAQKKIEFVKMLLKKVKSENFFDIPSVTIVKTILFNRWLDVARDENSHFFMLTSDGELLAKSHDSNSIEVLRRRIEAIMDEEKSVIESLEHMQWDLELECFTFSERLKELIASVELGNILRGKCNDCPKL